MEEVLKLRNKLNKLLSAEEVNEVKVTAVRERLLNAIKHAMNHTSDSRVKSILTNLYHREIENRKLVEEDLHKATKIIEEFREKLKEVNKLLKD